MPRTNQIAVNSARGYGLNSSTPYVPVNYAFEYLVVAGAGGGAQNGGGGAGGYLTATTGTMTRGTTMTVTVGAGG